MEAQEYLDSEIRYLRELQEADDLREDDIEMACSNLGPVSYTHLDVYKRQEFDVTMSVIESLLVRERDSEGKIHILSLIHI